MRGQPVRREGRSPSGNGRKGRARLRGFQKYINREVSWLGFNARVLAEAEATSNPLLERVKFLAIFESNLDEFYMVRVSGLMEQADAKIQALSPDGLTAAEQLEQIQPLAQALRQRANRLVKDHILPSLRRKKIFLLGWHELSSTEREALSERFETDVFPLCTPLLLDPAITFPFISNRSLNLAVELLDDGETKLARVKVPPILPRCVPIPGRKGAFILLEGLISAHLDRLFPGVEILGSHLFRVIRDADVEIRELEAGDLISAVEESLRRRRMGDAVLLEVQPTLSARWRQSLMKGLDLEDEDVFLIEGPLGLELFWEVSAVERRMLKHAPHMPYQVDRFKNTAELFEAIRQKPFLLHHPYDSFGPVEQYVGSVAHDPDVIGIKQTLYRVGQSSPLITSLLAGAEAGKQVAVMVELKARFDESNNLVWARSLERAGVHVSYGFADLKTHCKMCLVVRKEGEVIQTYAHIGTGNYNPVTARLYTDLGFFTTDKAICQDATELFNYLTGYSRQTRFRKLLVAPLNVREGIIERIQREAAIARRGGKSGIIFKFNSLVDPEVVDALYEASQAGVVIKLIVRGICTLRPGVPGLSSRIEVISIVGRFLEHSRVYYFENDGSPEALIGSADMMTRNLNRRIEVLAPVEDRDALVHLRQVVLEAGLKDNVKAWRLRPGGQYRRRRPRQGEERLSSQDWLLSHPAGKLVPAETLRPMEDE